MSLMDYLLLGVIALLVILAVCYMRKHKGGCQGCQYCPYAGECEKWGKKGGGKSAGK